MVFMIILVLFLSCTTFQVRADEPTVFETYQIALKKSGYDNVDLSSWKKRARLSNLLPTLQIGFVNRIANDIDIKIDENVYVGSSTTNVGPNSENFTESADLRRDFVARAVWDLSDVVFSKYELGISREKRDLFKAKSDLLETISKAYNQRQKMIKNLALVKKRKIFPKKGEGFDALKVEVESKLDEATSILDAYTEGWFSQRLNGREI